MLLPKTGVAQETLDIGLLIANKSQRSAYHQLAVQFEKAYPNITINYIVQDDKHYKHAIDTWLQQETGPDVLYWQAGNRLKKMAASNLIEPLDTLWLEQRWGEDFPLDIQHTLRYNQRIYALPYAFYQWGIYYKKSLFSSLNLSVPETWDAFLEVCAALKQKGINPIVIGGKDSWSVAAWFDYLNLRINGLDFHQQLMNGAIPYTDKRVVQVFNTWKKLIDLKYVVFTVDNKNWQEALPYIYHDIAGMTLLGTFAKHHISNLRSDDIGFFRFPQLKSHMPLYEETPIEVFMIPKNAQHKESARLFLTFVGQHKVQTKLNLALGYDSPYLYATAHRLYPVDSSAPVGQRHGVIAQYFDRDTHKAMSLKGIEIMAEFLTTADVSRATSELEKARLRAFSQAP
ncbi:ABC transporter substrate-binding protein [Paraglaciecola mesophila]|nr:extracellular solute-binding protein [Paraglaciecola mesophila]